MKLIKTILLACFILASQQIWAQNDKFKALFIYNFTKYIEWPTGASPNFTITVLGESPIITELNNISKVKKVGPLSIEIKKANSVAEIGESHILYIPNSKNRFLNDIIAKSQGKNMLIITDEVIDKSHVNINFSIREGKQSFEISKTKLESHHLKINSGLLLLGQVVD